MRAASSGVATGRPTLRAIERGLRPTFGALATDGQVFLRGFKHLFAFGKPASSSGTAMASDGE